METLLAIRHLRTKDNTEQRFSSGERNIPIIPDQTISKEILEALQGLKKEKYFIAHTGLKRTKQTANLLAEELSFRDKLIVFPEFRERLGDKLTGLTFPEIKQLFPELQSPNELWKIEAPELGLEPAEDFLLRIKDGISRLSSFTPNTCILVAHAGSIKGIKTILTGQKQTLCNPTPEHSKIFQFNISKGGSNGKKIESSRLSKKIDKS